MFQTSQSEPQLAVLTVSTLHIVIQEEFKAWKDLNSPKSIQLFHTVCKIVKKKLQNLDLTLPAPPPLKMKETSLNATVNAPHH